MLPIDWKASAVADLFDILEAIGEHDQDAAARLLEGIGHDLEHAAEHPFLFKPSQRVFGMREIVTHPNYVVLYRVTGRCIEVVNIVHARREFPGGARPE
ncbi:MAG: type II toxin-antitoxin system RelE/ParE family toxin [Pseudomonadota bacterium]